MLANLLKTSPSWERFVLHVRLDEIGPWLKVIGPAILQRLEKHWNSLVLWFPNKLWFPHKRGYVNPIHHLPFLLEKHPDEIGVTADAISNLFLTNHEKATDTLEMAEYLGQCWQSMDLCMLPSDGALRVGRPFTIPRTISLHHTPRLTFLAALRMIQSIQGDGATAKNTDSTSASKPLAVLVSRRQGNVHWVRLSLSHLDIGNDGANVIADLLQNNHQWQIFDVAHTALDDTGIKALVEGMKSNRDWRCMNVSRSKIGTHGARKLGRALDGNDRWPYFSIANTDTSNAGVSKLAFVLEDREWHTVDVGFTHITDRGLKTLSEALNDGESSSWQHLRLSHCSLHDEGAIRLAMALRENSRWRKFDVGNTNMTDHDMKQVLEALENNVDWHTMDMRYNEQLQLGAHAVKTLTNADPTWKSMEYKPPTSIQGLRKLPLLLTAGSSTVTNRESIQVGRLIVKTKNDSTYTVAVKVEGRVDAQVGENMQCLDTSLDMAIQYGVTLIAKLETIMFLRFVELGERLLEVSASLGRINQIRLQMTSRKEELKQLNPHRLKKLQEIMTFGIDLAKMMHKKLPSENQKPKYHVFISFAGEVRKELEFDYVTRLEQQLQDTAGGGNTLNIFVAEKTMHAGQQSDPLVTMLTNALTARVVVCVTSTHYVQKKWCIAELLCALARNETVCPWTGVSRVIVDAFPGSHWVLPSFRATSSVSIPDTSKHNTDIPTTRSAKKWLDDFCCLFPTRLPTMQICEITGENVYGKRCRASTGRNNSCGTS